MKEQETLSSQAALARAAGCCSATVSRARGKRESVSMENYKKFAELTGLDVQMWISGDRRVLKRELRKFFKDQKYER